MTMKKNYKKYIVENKHMGFDELALNLGIDKEEVKMIWNKAGLGYHMTPQTLIDFRRLANDKYQVLHDMVVFIAPATPILVYKGTITDFASVPKFLHFLIDKDDNDVAIGALVHDVLYQTEWFSRGVADNIFLQLMKYRKCPTWKRWLAFAGVRVGGWVVWLHHSKKAVVHARKELLLAIKRYTKDITYTL
jgi:hypothetical protein